MKVIDQQSHPITNEVTDQHNLYNFTPCGNRPVFILVFEGKDYMWIGGNMVLSLFILF